MEKEYESFYQEYKKKLNEQYPSVKKSHLSAPPVSPFLINISKDTVSEIQYLVQLFL